MDKNEKEKSGTNCSYSIASILGFGKILFLKNPGIFLRKVLVGCGGPQLTALEYLFCTTLSGPIIIPEDLNTSEEGQCVFQKSQP